uniref:Uncharacterized protein n=1 Tax=Setaria viridis TaxID=4556 RepID=A0A4U6UMM1_SETVI|nr:hypothetical protein SEVIR_5G280400v2 [Setaria viridis]TKW16159.1 hypothetical protein SEVIR_5G280800v2 [Setaria viridis]
MTSLLSLRQMDCPTRAAKASKLIRFLMEICS